MSTGDWFILDQYSVVGRSVSFTLLPAEIVQNVLVYKTQDASMLEGGVSGAVDIQTRNPLGLSKPFTFEASAEAAYNTNAGQHGSQWQPQFNGLVGWKNNDDTFEAILQGFCQKAQRRPYGPGSSRLHHHCRHRAGRGDSDHAVYPGYRRSDRSAKSIPERRPGADLIGSSLFEQERTRASVTGSGRVENLGR